MRNIAAIFAALILLCLAGVAAKAQTEAAKPPQKVEELLKLLSDPDVQKWLDAQKAASAKPATAAPAQPRSEIALDAAFERMRAHLVSLVAAIPALPAEIARVASQISGELQGYGPIRLLLIFLVFLAAGFAAEWVFRRLTGGIRAWIAAARLDGVADRLIAMAERLLYSAASLAAFAAGSIGVFLAFTWPRLLHPIIIGYLVAVLIFRASRLVFEFILSPPEYTGFGEPSRFRVLPVSDASASFWVKRISYAIGWYAFGWTTVMLMGELGFIVPTRMLMAYALGVVLLAMGIEAVWNRPGQVTADPAEPSRSRLSANAQNWLITTYFVATPCYGGTVFYSYVVSIINFDRAARRAGMRVEFFFRPGDSLITRSRNVLLAHFLSDKSLTHLFWIDGDIGFSQDAAMRLLLSGHDVAAGIYPIKGEHWPAEGVPAGTTRQIFESLYARYPVNAQGEKTPEGEVRLDIDADGFIKVREAPTGFMVIKRSVFEALIDKYPNYQYTPDWSGASDFPGDVHYRFFDTMIDPVSKRYLSEDYSFCHLVKSLGTNIYIDAHSRLTHYGGKIYMGDLSESLRHSPGHALNPGDGVKVRITGLQNLKSRS